MKKFLAGLFLFSALTGGAHAAGGGIEWDKAPNKTNDTVAMQNGAKIFVNNCLNCHAAAYMRFNRLKDIGLTDQQIKDNLLFTTDRVGDTMHVSMSVKNAKDWFGVVPPDLTLIARSRSAAGKGTGADYLYTYLRTYYRDDTKPTGWNNLAYPNSAMPHVLWEMQGERKPVFAETVSHGHTSSVFKGWEQVSAGTMSQLEFDKSMADLVGYLQWMSEPGQNTRVQIGVWVLLFLLLMTFAAWRLNAAFWKDVK